MFRSRLDGGKLENALTGLGIDGIDVATSTVRRTVPLTPAQARTEYRGSWAARREIDRPAGDLVREGYELTDLPEWVDVAAVYSYLSDLGDAEVPEDRGALPALSRLYAEANKTKGAALVWIVEDGLPTWQPMDLSRIQRIRGLELLECDEIWPYYHDARKRVPEYYVIGTARTQIKPASIVHRSRVILSKGARLSPSEEWANNGWGASQLEVLRSERQAMHVALDELGSAVHRQTIDAVYLAELAELLEDCEGSADVEARLRLIATHRGQHKIIPLDAGREGTTDEPGRPPDKIESIARPVEGLATLGEYIQRHWAGATGQTPSIALGDNVGGLNTGENSGDWMSWGSHMGGEQERWLRPRLERVLEVAFACRTGPTGGRIPERWAIEFPSLWKPTALEEAQVAQLWAAIDGIYVGMKAIAAEQVAEQRLRKGVTGMLTLGPADDDDLDEDGDMSEEAPDEVAVAFSTDPIPGDLKTARQLAEALTERFGMRITTRRITGLRKAGKLRPFPLLGGVGYSEGEALRLIAVENGLIAGAEQPRGDAVGLRIWRTQGDADVRPEHAALEGVVFEVGERHPTEGEPGEAYGCRCYWEMVPVVHSGRSEPTKKQQAAAERAKKRAAKLARER